MTIREALRGALTNVLSSATNYPERVQACLLGQNMGPLTEKVTDAALAVLSNLPGDASDGHHTFDELYDYRMLYNAHAAHGWLAAGIPVVKSWRHSDGELCFGGGWFIVTATLPTGQVSNHYRAEHWGLFAVPAVDLPSAYDGHTPADTVDRLRSALAVFEQSPGEAIVTPTTHDHSKEPTAWCETHQHEHIARMPRFTYLCKDCGWGQWYGDDAREHELWTQENLREAHTTYEVEHVMRPLITPTNDERSRVAAILVSNGIKPHDPKYPLIDALALRSPVQGEPTADLTPLEKTLCPKCGWSRSSHLRSSYGLDCPWGQSPSALKGRLPALRAAFATEQGES